MQVRAVSRLYKTIPSATVVHRCLQVPLDNQYHFFVHFLQIVFLPRAATMAVFPCYVLLLLSVWAPSASTSPHHTIDSALTTTLESSGSGPPEPPGLMLHRGVVKVVRLDSNHPARGSGLFKRAPTAHRGGPRRPFPAFLSRGRAGPAGGQAGAPPPPPREKESPRGLEARKRQGLQMWQQAVSKEQHSGKVSLALSLKEARQQTCRAIPFPQVTPGPHGVLWLSFSCFR